ncbi:MAG: LamG-like jellyroll fold domain-containing protein [Candidatus Micrarchaeaceae archaeon]
MKAFRKGNSQREFHQSFALQSAMEYLMTYGWAILIIAVVLAALFELGVFNPMTFAPKASPGSCQVLRPEGAGTTDFISLSGECNGELPQYAAQFNGQSSAIETSGINSLSTSNYVTISFWMDWSGATSTTPLGFGGSSCSSQALLWEQSSTCWGFNPCGVYSVYGINAQPIIGRWVFVTAIYNTTMTNSRLFINGVQQTLTQCAGSASNLVISNSILFGMGEWSGDFSGSIANVQVYNTALSSNDIKALYQEGIGGAPIKIQNLVAWYPLNGNANDYSGNGNNGVPSGVTYTSNWYSGYSAP